MKTISILILGVLFCSPLAWGQASVNESLETAQLYVDTNTGSDSNPGTQALPLKTIGAAATLAIYNNKASIGTQVNINPGTYRESIAFGTGSNTTSLPITFQATVNGTAIVSGADVWTGWKVYSGNSNIFTNPWPYQWGLCAPDTSGPAEQDIVLRREMIAVNGTVMTQVLSLNEVQAGTFYVDETGGTVYLWPPTGTNISTATVEVATRSGLLNDFGLSNVVLRGLTFEYDNSCRHQTAVTITSSGVNNVLIDSDNFNWNNAGGLNLSGVSDFTVQNSTANHNGELGTNEVMTKNGLWQGNETSYNNWRGAQGVYYGWNSSGAHYFQAHNDTISDSKIIYNQSHGIHWDTDNANITADSVFASGNLIEGVFIERNEGPLSIYNSSLCNTNPPAGSKIGDAISINNSEFVSLTNDILYNGGNPQITIAGNAGGYMITNWETGQVYNLVTQNLTLMQSTIEGVGAGQGIFQDGLGASDWLAFTSTLVSDYNTWWNASNSTPWSIPGSPFNTLLDFTGWKAATLTDVHSVFQAPVVDPSTACQATPDAPDYWLLSSAGSLTVRPTTPAVFTAAVTAVGDFTGAVNLSSDGVQNIPGATASWSANSITGSGAATFTVNTTSSTPAGTYNVVLIASSGSVVRTSTVSVIVDSMVGISPNSVTFSSTQVGSSSVQKVTLTNNGKTSLTGVSINITGANGNFSETNTCGSSLAAGAKCTISATFSPRVSGTLTATLQITDSDPTSPQTVPLTGTATAPVAEISPSSLTFGDQVVNTTSAAQVVTITNTGTAPLTIDSITANGNFADTTTCGATLAVNASCTVSVTFTPKQAGSLTGNLDITDNAVPNFVKVALSGTGTQPVASLTPSTLNYGSQEVGTTSAAQTATLTNTGTASLSITSITSTKADYKISSNKCGSTLGVGQSCTISITFTPAFSGTRDGDLEVTDNASPSTQKVSLQGTGSS